MPAELYTSEHGVRSVLRHWGRQGAGASNQSVRHAPPSTPQAAPVAATAPTPKTPDGAARPAAADADRSDVATTKAAAPKRRRPLSPSPPANDPFAPADPLSLPRPGGDEGGSKRGRLRRAARVDYRGQLYDLERG